MSERPPRRLLLPPSVIDAVIDTAPTTSRAELLHRLELALAELPPAERTAVVSAHGYDEGPVGAAVELDIDTVDADALTRNALQLLRGALADLDTDD
jgi:DNA-directed RNA polymerase specialized sigma24 family protein